MQISSKDLDKSIITCYMLKEKATGLFWKGGVGPVKCDKNGKVWRRLNHLRCAISQHNDQAILSYNRDKKINIIIEDDYEILELSYNIALSGFSERKYIPFIKE